MFKKRIQNGATHASYAVVTGAGSGIGRALSIELARRGGEVVCSDLMYDSAAETADMCRAVGGVGLAVQCDVSQLEQVEDLAMFAETKLSAPVSLVINNAGIGAGGHRVGELGVDSWHRAIAVNLWGPIHGCEVFVPILRRHGSGGIINIASAAAFAAAPLMGPYCVTKSGVLALSELLAAELSDTPITVSVACPTLVKTNIVSNAHVADGPTNVAQRLMDAIGTSPERLACTVLDGHDRGRLYIAPQLDAKITWRAKRYLPHAVIGAMKLSNRVAARRLPEPTTSPS